MPFRPSPRPARVVSPWYASQNGDDNNDGKSMATAISGVTQDILGSLRPLDGDQDGDALPDIGCCEFNPDQVGDVSAKLQPDRTEVAVGEQIGFTLSLDGFDAGSRTRWESFAPGVTTDLAGRRRVRGGAIDFGAFEYHAVGLAVVVR